ncbi:hypothetical protein MBLNU457_g0082t1 [Dothideomycetes sp. NU457]
MKISSICVAALGITSSVNAAAIPDVSSLSIRSIGDAFASIPLPHSLEKRKGGGGGGGGRGGGGSVSSGSSSSGSSGSSSGAKGGSGATTGSSNTGGRAAGGSGVAPSYGGGRYYGGGATTPYSSGARSPLGIAPVLLVAPALAFGGLWAYGAYAYPYAHPYTFHNASSHNNTNTTLPVECLCAQYQECGCDDNNDTSYLDSVVGNGTNLNSTLARVRDVNGTQTLLINGTLPNGTTAATSGASRLDGWATVSGWWMTAAVVTAIVLEL